MNFQEIILATTIVLAALMAGFFFAYSFSVNDGLRKLDDKAYLSAMQSINKEVLNPTFFICFFGALILLVLSAVLYFDIRSPKWYLIVLACVIYAIGVFMVTGVKNVPLNNELAAFDIDRAPGAALKNMRNHFEDTWIFWNSIRTLASFLTLVCLIIVVVFMQLELV